jgi:hypothetical protein
MSGTKPFYARTVTTQACRGLPALELPPRAQADLKRRERIRGALQRVPPDVSVSLRDGCGFVPNQRHDNGVRNAVEITRYSIADAVPAHEDIAGRRRSGSPVLVP